MEKGFTKKLKGIIATTLAITVILSTCLFSGCTKKGYSVNKNLDTSKQITIKIASSRTDLKAIELLANEFTKLYPNCKVEHEYMQDYSNLLINRLTSDEDCVDIFYCENIQSDSKYLDYAVNILDYPEQVDLSGTLPGLIKNFKYFGDSADAPEKLYSIPVGGELRGMFVNKTLLSQLGVAVPTNRTEFLDACQKISDAGYIPLQSNPGTFAQQLLYPYIAHIISTAEDPVATHNMVNTADEATAELLRDPMEFLYSLEVNNYYNYKYVENTYNTFKSFEFDSIAKDFLGIAQNEDETYQKTDDVGSVAFITSPNSVQTYIDKNAEDYHIGIDYEFILAPVTDDGGCAYLSPASGIAINKNSPDAEWCLEFFNFMFSPENAKKYAENDNIIPNTSDAIEYVSKKFNIPQTQITEVKDMTFDYSFYNIIVKALTEISKSNNPKYMTTDENGNSVMYDFEHYMDGFKAGLASQREKFNADKG